jgi:hypothetical protein
MTYSTVSVPSFVLAIWLCLSSLNSAAAAPIVRRAVTAKTGTTKVCNTDADGVMHCTEKLSGAVIAAIIVTTVAVIGLAIVVWWFIRRSRARAASAEDQLQVEASQMQGPPPIIGVNAIPSSRKRGKNKQLASTTYAATYDTSSAPVLPQLAYAAGSAPVFSNAGPPSAPLAARMGHGQAYGYGPGSAGPFATPPQTAPNGKAFGQKNTPYPFTGISSNQLPPMPQPGPSYAGGGYGNRI